MANNHPPATVARQTTVLLLCVTVLACFVISAVVIAYVAVPDGANTGSVIAIMIGTLAPTIAAMAAVIASRQSVQIGQAVQQTVSDVAHDTERLTNSVGDAKIRAAVADVVDPAYHADGAAELLAHDRAVVEANHREVDAGDEDA